MFACPSTGNLANAVAAAGARAGIPTVVFIPHDLELPKIVASAIYTNLVAVRGNYDDVNRLASEIAGEEDGWAFVNVNVRPYYAEGSKTLGYEVAEQLGWRLPENVVIPVASGSQLTKVDKAFQELVRLGLVEEKPYRIFGAQATGCSPISAAFKDGHDVVRPVEPDTIAKSLAIGNPADGPYVLDVARRTGGAVEDIDDELVRQGIELLARTEGVFAETAGGVTVGVLKKLVETGQLDPAGDRRVQHRQGPEDARRGRGPGGPGCDHRPVVRRVHRGQPDLAAPGNHDSEERNHERQRPDPHHPAQLHRRRVRGDRGRRDPRRGARRPRGQPQRHQGAGARRPGRDPAVRQRLRRQRRRALPRGPGHATPEGTQISIIPAVAGG